MGTWLGGWVARWVDEVGVILQRHTATQWSESRLGDPQLLLEMRNQNLEDLAIFVVAAGGNSISNLFSMVEFERVVNSACKTEQPQPRSTRLSKTKSDYGVHMIS